MRNRLAPFYLLIGMLLNSPAAVFAQTNSWISPANGNWEDAHWSLGELPSTNQIILFTNAGSKTLTIGPNTVQNFPETLTVDTISVSSIPGSVNTLVLNQTGLQTGSFIVDSNSMVLMQSSSLSIHGESPIAGIFSVTGGRVMAGFSALDVGQLGPAAFYLTNSLLEANVEYLGGFPTAFSQSGGTNSVSVGLVLRDQSHYNLFDGVINDGAGGPSLIVFEGRNGEFNQHGGNFSAVLRYWEGVGSYNLMGGTLSCGDLTVPDKSSIFSCVGYFSQSGGTNLTGQLVLGDNAGMGSYRLSGGTLVSTGLVVNAGFNSGEEPATSGFYQSGGFNTNGGVQIFGGSVYELSAGILATASFSLSPGKMLQSGGTNRATNVSLNSISDYSLSGGWLVAQNVAINGLGGSWGQPGIPISTFEQSDGTNIVSGNLSLASVSKYLLEGGRLIARDFTINDSAFYHDGGTVSVSGVVTLMDGIWRENMPGEQLGQLQLGGTNSVLSLPASGSCVLQWADSSGLPWPNNSLLGITNWSGSLYGGGPQQILFGTNSSALTLQQISQIQFQNPAGLPQGSYAARILATGEIVPDSGATLPMKMTIARCPTNPAMQINLCGDIGQSYDIEVSTDLVNWIWWTNKLNSNGTISIPDCGATNYSQRFYRARLAP